MEGDQLLARVGIAEFGRMEKETLKTGLSNARYAKAWLHAEPLAADDRKTLVDMPGLDSGLSTHNAAIQRYLPLGSYFILVVDIEHGALRDSELRQLREFLGREVEFAVLVNKADKKKADVDAIVGHIREQVQQTLQKEKTTPVHAVSAHEANMAAFGQNCRGRGLRSCPAQLLAANSARSLLRRDAKFAYPLQRPERLVRTE